MIGVVLGVVWAGAAVAGELTGIVVDSVTKAPLVGATVQLVGTERGAIAGPDGRFALVDISPGQQRLEASMLGYRTGAVEVAVPGQGSVDVVLPLASAPVSIREVVVTPGRFAIMQGETAVRQTLSEEDIHSIPQVGEDIYRAVTRIPGVAASDFSAKFTVRGGEHEEILVLLDGLQLYEPFHLKDIGGGALSIVDVVAIGGIDLMTGAFPARYGDHMSGVFDMRSVTPGARDRTSLGVSLTNIRFFTEGQFAAGRGGWVVSARRGYLDFILGLLDEDDFKPTYYDVFGKVEYRLDGRHKLAAHVLHADDHTIADDGDGGLTATTDYGNSYAWLRLQSTFGDRLGAETVLSGGQVEGRRRGVDTDRFFFADRDGEWNFLLEDFSVDDARDFQVLGLKQDWAWEYSSDQLLGWGFDVKRLTAEYDYFNRELVAIAVPRDATTTRYDTTRSTAAPDGTQLGLHASLRQRLGRLTVEAGGRYDRVSYTDDGDISPRLNLAYSMGSATVVRAGWGNFRQAMGIDEWAVQFGDQIFYPSQVAQHWVLGVEHRLESGLDARLELYHKELDHVRPRYENLSKDVLFFPELEEENRFLAPESGRARGIELYLKHDAGGRFTWWGSYAFALAEERVGGEDVPKGADQRHTLYLDANYRPSDTWRLSAAWQFRTGWPYTGPAAVPVETDNGVFYRFGFAQRHGLRLPAYHRLDLRLNRHFAVGDGRLTCFVELVNLYDHDNVAFYNYNSRIEEDGTLTIFRRFAETWLPRIPSLGVSYSF